MSKVDQQAKIIWDYMLVHDELKPADLIICLGSHDLNVARRAAELYLASMAPKILVTGGRGKLTKHDSQTEAAAFAAIMYAAGVPEEDVLIEGESTNTGDNARYSKRYVEALDIHMDIQMYILVTKPYMERRAKATFAQFWPGTGALATSQQISYEDYMGQSSVGKEESINIMVGDLQRIMEYPAKGWMVPQTVPKHIKSAFDYLVKHGYNRRLA